MKCGKKISLELIGTGKIHLINNELQPKYVSKSILKLPKLADTWFKIKSYELKSNPGHKILENILNINKNALASCFFSIQTYPKAGIEVQVLAALQRRPGSFQ